MNKQLPPPAQARNPRVKDLATEVLRVMPGLKRSAGEWRSSSHEGLPSAVEDRARLVPCAWRWCRIASENIAKKIEDLREAHPSTTVPCSHEVGKSISGYRRRGRETQQLSQLEATRLPKSCGATHDPVWRTRRAPDGP
jgi:hypothetical protein